MRVDCQWRPLHEIVQVDEAHHSFELRSLVCFIQLLARDHALKFQVKLVAILHIRYYGKSIVTDNTAVQSKNEFLLLDVRETWEREECRIEPSLHIPLGEFSSPENLDLPVETSSAEKIVVYCKAGVRSMMACQSLSALGFQNLYNLSGGMMRWGDGS